MMTDPVFRGAGAALVTLFDDNGEVDYAATAAHAARLAELGTAAIAVCGTTGEVDALSDDERLRLFDAVRAAVPPSSGTAVLAGTGATSTRQARALTARARDCGADAFLARSPRAVADPRDYYRAIAEAAGVIPVLGYHFPAVSPPGIPLCRGSCSRNAGSYKVHDCTFVSCIKGVGWRTVASE